MSQNSRKVSKEEIMEKCEKAGVKFLNMQFTDLMGIIKAVTIPFEKLSDAIDDNLWFDGSSVEGFTRICESDMFLKPDLNTFSILPWTKDEGKFLTGRIICDVYMADGSPFKGDPRYILKRALKKAEEMGFDTFNIGPELEFFLFKKENGVVKPLPHDKGGYFDQEMDLAAEIRKEMSATLMEMGIEVEQLHHEVAAGSHEIDFKYADALTTADNSVTFRYVLKSIAAKYGLHATFMPKPIQGINGSGMHVHQSLFTKGENKFYEEKDAYHLSEDAKNFIAGQLKYIREVCLITDPTVNSYKRLVPGYEAPVYISWATTNRSALIRIPRFTKGKTSAVRCELRCPDPASNPYLVFATILLAGLKGIEENLMPGKPVENKNLYEYSEEQLEKEGIKLLPESMGQALNIFKKSELAREILGDHAYESYIAAKKAEWSDYCLSVSQWEIDRYLEIY